MRSAFRTDSSGNTTDSRRTSARRFSESSICPFKLQWSIGINPKVPLLNLTTENRWIIAYASSHAVILYDYQTKETIPLQGHQDEVATMSVSRDGKWLLTADYGDDSAVVVWDTETGVPVCTLFNPHGSEGMTAARISPNAKYVVTVGNEQRQRISFWCWTYGNTKPDASCKLSGNSAERIREICFNEDRCEEFVLTRDHNVLFSLWMEDRLEYHTPQVRGKTRQYGIFNCSCFIVGTPRAITGTENGFILIWRRASEDETRYEHFKYIQLQRCSITTLLNHRRYVVTGNAKGRVTFYDRDLKILYWCHNPGMDSIQSVGFDLQSNLRTLGHITERSGLELFRYSDYGENSAEEMPEFTWNEVFCGRDVECNVQCAKSSASTLQQVKVCSTLTVNLELSDRATDATIENAPFYVSNFFLCTATGVIALIEVSKLQCHFFLQDFASPITSLATHPDRNYVVTGDGRGMLRLYNYQDRSLLMSKKVPPLPDFMPIFEEQTANKETVYVTCPESHKSQIGVTELKYSPDCDMLVCGMESGAIWMLHPLSLKPLEKSPYKHSSESILKVIFTECSEYMAYSDNGLTVAAFKRNHKKKKSNVWNFLGKYHSHYLPIADILFLPPTSDSDTPRLFSLGEDRDLVEYDLKNSGPYPDPGLQILETTPSETTATPLCLSSYPNPGLETFLMISNSEYKYRLLNDITKTIRGTFLGPTFGAPVQQLEVRSDYSKNYVIFVTDKEVGLQLLPVDGNPYKSIGMIGHPRKIKKIAIGCEGTVLFTCGCNDPCVLMWRIQFRSVDMMSRLGGEGLSPYYCLIEGGRSGSFIREMQDLFYYAQILHQGENTTNTRVVTDKLVIKQIPNLLRAVGFYPTNEELEFIMGEVAYKSYAETGHMVEEVTFDDFVKLYINHRPVSGVSIGEVKNAFLTLSKPFLDNCMLEKNPSLSRQQFLDVLFGKDPHKSRSKTTNKVYGEPLTRQEALLFLHLLATDEEDIDIKEEATITANDFNFLPERISYKEFITDIMGIDLPEELRADSD